VGRRPTIGIYGGAFTHGGARMGSCGCIKLMNPGDLNDFALRLRASGQDWIYLKVMYSWKFKSKDYDIGIDGSIY